MTNKSQVIAQIRFQLEQLSTRNAHHEFEHLCRHLARERICSNILPATGPVSAGGDQGRDFETFRTYLEKSPIANSSFIGKLSQQPIAFACTIQKQEINSKIQSDISTIMESGSSIQKVVYFSTADIPIAQRHKLISWAKTKYSIALEIHDGQSISELLTDREIFWIAEQFLGIPSDIFPRTAEEDDWYTQLLTTWKERKTPRLTYADFFEIKEALRHATFEATVKQDLNFWINLIQHFISNQVPPELKRKAIYEMAVASLRGLGTLNGQENQLREYFESIPEMERVTELEDVPALLNYNIGAFRQNRVQLTADEIITWRKKVLKKLEDELRKANTPSQKCPLFEIKGYLFLSINPKTLEQFDLKETIHWWTKLIEIAGDAPLFPLERFADRLTNYLPYFGTLEGYQSLSQETDVLLSKRYGEIKAAEKCKDRALKFFEIGETLKAINELHKAKVKWFTDETLQGSILAVLVIAQAYQKLGLSFAAKYYALAATSLALLSSKPEINSKLPQALVMAAESDYLQGSWFGFLDLAEQGLVTYSNYTTSKDTKPLDVFDRILFDTSTIIAITSVLEPELVNHIKKRVKKWNLEDWFKDLLPMAYSAWGKDSVTQIWNELQKQTFGRPFGDLGETREALWSELGLTWRVSWINDYVTTSISEQLCAVMQIVLADLAGIELCLLKTNVKINVSIEDSDEIAIEPIPSNSGRKWKIVFPNKQFAAQELQIKVLTIITTILSEASLLPKNQFNEKVEDMFKNGISMKAFVAQPYQVLYQQLIGKETFDSADRAGKQSPCHQMEFKTKENHEISWVDCLGPGYSKEKQQELIKNRYSKLLSPIKFTLCRLQKSDEIKEIVQKLRSEGWLDWHILTAIYNLATNYRINSVGCVMDEQKVAEYANLPEEVDFPTIPIEEFTEEKMKTALNLSMLSTLRILGLEIRQGTPDFDGIKHFLGHKYNYWTDDIPHENPFPQ